MCGRGHDEWPARSARAAQSRGEPAPWAAVRQRAGHAARAVWEVLAPTRCAGCERAGALICDRCLEDITPIDPVHACLACGAPFGDVLCTECARTARGEAAQEVPDGQGRWCAACVFDGPVPRIVRSYKDAGEHRLAPLIAALMVDAATHAEHVAPERYGGIMSAADALVFIPATAAAYRRRGFDHMELIAREVSAQGGPPVLDALVKHGSSDQRALGRAGRIAAAGKAYEVVADARGMRLLLVDDVVTTGATLRAATRALLDAGAQLVEVLAFARVW